MLLSILIPTYNEEKTILKLLQLISYQKKKINLEILICDDGSNDFTYEILVKNNTMYDVLLTNKKNAKKGNAIKI
jgi:glycosyltransferase involved in cell wall biosynthesis